MMFATWPAGKGILDADAGGLVVIVCMLDSHSLSGLAWQRAAPPWTP